MSARALLVLAALVAGCGTTGTSAPETPACDLNLDSIVGRTFVELEVQGDKSEKPNPQARLKFRKDGDQLKAWYTVKNALNVYDYVCHPSGRDNEVKCTTPPEYKRACLALEVNKDGACTAEAIEKAGYTGGSDDEIAKAIKEAKELVAKAKTTEQWKTFQLMNNNVANVLQAVLYVKIKPDLCRLQIDDMFSTIFNGEVTEDFNPVGTNAFVQTDTEYLFEDCDHERMLADMNSAELPKRLEDIPPVREHKVGAEVHYHYVGDKGVKAEDGCTYTVDTWANWEPVEKGKAVAVENGKVQWYTTHTWAVEDLKYVGADKGRPLSGGFFHMARRKTCGDKTETVEVVCNAARVSP